jgi:hypothetical protein
MNKLISFSLALILMIGWINLACAADTASVQISCIIPAIPGVNAPLISDKQNSPQGVDAVKNAQKEAQNNAPKISTKEETIVFIMHESVRTQSGPTLAGAANQAIVRTIYSR